MPSYSLLGSLFPTLSLSYYLSLLLSFFLVSVSVYLHMFRFLSI